jgi:hypothetical protein
MARKRIKTISEQSSKQQAFLAALEKTGDVELSRTIACLDKEELNGIASDQLQAAMSAYEARQLEEYLGLIKTAKQIALATKSVRDLLAIAAMVAPKSALYPSEKVRAKAKQDQAQPTAVQLNVGMNTLAERLQAALREIGPAPKDLEESTP